MKNKQIILNAVAWQAIADKIDVEPMQRLLDERVDLKQYGEGVKQIVFTFIAVPKSDTFHENEAIYEEGAGTVKIALRLSYEHVKDATKERCLQMMVSLFLVSLDLWEGMRVKKFDVERFRKELHKLYETER